MNLKNCLKSAVLQLKESSQSASLDSSLLLSNVIGRSREWLISHGEEVISIDQLQHFQALVRQRKSGVPIAYLIGFKEFFGLDLAVNSSVLVPRPETECLVEWILSHYSNSSKKVLDLGTGSGAIIISLAINRSKWECSAGDVSLAALEVARQNALSHQLERIKFITSSWFDSIDEANYDIIVANPPYIAVDDEHLGGLKHEPDLALVAADNGLSDLNLIIKGALEFLAQDGVLVLEHGYRQQDAVMGLARQAGYAAVSGYVDLSGLPRYIVAKMA